MAYPGAAVPVAGGVSGGPLRSSVADVALRPLSALDALRALGALRPLLSGRKDWIAAGGSNGGTGSAGGMETEEDGHAEHRNRRDDELAGEKRTLHMPLLYPLAVCFTTDRIVPYNMFIYGH